MKINESKMAFVVKKGQKSVNLMQQCMKWNI